MRYKKLPVIIEAFKWTGGPDQTEDPKWINEALLERRANIFIDTARDTCFMRIHTLEGDMIANSGDYIIKGIKGEIYPCKENIFLESYEKVDV